MALQLQPITYVLRYYIYICPFFDLFGSDEIAMCVPRFTHHCFLTFAHTSVELRYKAIHLLLVSLVLGARLGYSHGYLASRYRPLPTPPQQHRITSAIHRLWLLVRLHLNDHGRYLFPWATTYLERCLSIYPDAMRRRESSIFQKPVMSTSTGANFFL